MELILEISLWTGSVIRWWFWQLY